MIDMIAYLEQGHGLLWAENLLEDIDQQVHMSIKTTYPRGQPRKTSPHHLVMSH